MVALRNFFSLISNMFGGEGWFSHSDKVERMDGQKALSYAPVWHCVSKISGAFMIMPLNLHQKKGRDINRVVDHPSYRLNRWRPNAYQTPSQWKRQMMCHALLWGNMRSYIHREGRTPVELIPLMPDRTATMLLEGEKWHATLINRDDRLSLFEDMEGKQEQVIWMRDGDVWHVPGLGFDGVNGQSLIYLARQSWGIGLNAEKHIASQQKKGYSGGLMLEAPVGVFRNEADAKEFLDKFREQHDGVDNAGKAALLREGVKANVMQMSNSDAQFLEQRRFQREDTALLFLLEGILGDTSHASYNSLEQKNLAYRLNCLAPWTTAIEEESDLKLLTDRERAAEYYHKFNDGALLRTEKGATMAFVSQGIASTVLNPNEARQLFDLNPYEGGDEYGNPNTTSNKPDNGAGGAANTPDPTPKSQLDKLIKAVKDANQNLPKSYLRELLGFEPAENKATTALLSHLFGVEANRITSGAEKASNFIEWMDNFYSKKWESVLADNMEAMGLDRELATIHCTESKRRLLEVCDYSTAETLVENVKKCVSNWKLRSNSIGVLENV